LKLTGAVLQLVYRLRRHWWLGWPLSRWLGLLLVVATGAGLILAWTRPWAAAATGGAYLAYLAVLTWARQQKFLRFEPHPDAETLLGRVAAAAPLRSGETVPIRASGWFTVEGKDQYYVDLEADYETVTTREHIILARVYPSRFLLLGRWPAFELGWWYIFFQPAMIREVAVGHLYFGTSPRLALRIVYQADEKTQQRIHLAFDDGPALRRVWDDLQIDAPAHRQRGENEEA